jgi:hypothetical protein
MVCMPQLARLLAALTALVLLSGCKKSGQYSGAAPPAVSSSTAEAVVENVTGIAFAKPTLDLPAERLSERVDGAEVKLRSMGCQRLRLWRLQSPPADLELLTFANEGGASKMLAEQAGPDRAPNMPGDEGFIGSNVLYFRSKALFVRLIADGPESASAMLAPARQMAQALNAFEVTP